MSTRVRDEAKHQDDSDATLRSIGRKAQSAISSAAHQVASAADRVSNVATRAVGSILPHGSIAGSGTPRSATTPSTSSVTAQPTDKLTEHTRSLQDKYDAFDSRTVALSLPHTGSAATVASSLAAVAELAPAVIGAHQRPIIGEVAAAPATRVETAYYTNSKEPTMGQYCRTRAAGALPRLYSNIVDVNPVIPGAHTTLYTAGAATQREIDRTRAAGCVPRLYSFYQTHHNAVPPASVIGPAAVTLAIQGPDGAVQAVGPAQMPEHERSDLARALAIERTRRAADLDWQPTSTDLVNAAAVGAADAIKASLSREESARLRDMEKASRALIDSKREENARIRAQAQRDLQAHEAREREREAAWERQQRAANDRIAAGEREYQQAKAALAKAHASEIGAMEQRCRETERELSAARAEAQKLVAEHEKALALPRYAVDTSDVDTAEMRERKRIQEQLRALDLEEQRLLAHTQEEQQRWQNEKAAREQEQRGLLARVDSWRQKIRAESREALAAIEKEVKEREAASGERERGLRDRLNQLRDTIREREGRVRELETTYQQRHEAAFRERQQLAADIAALERERENILHRASSDNARILAEKERQIAQAREHANAVIRDAEEDLIKARREVSVAMSRAQEAREAAVIRGGELGLCVEVEEREVIPATLARGRLQEAIGVEERVQNVRVVTPTLVRETVHIGPVGVHEHNYRDGQVRETPIIVDTATVRHEERDRGFFGKLFGGWGRAEAASMPSAPLDEDALAWHMYSLRLSSDTESEAEDSAQSDCDGLFTDEED